MQKNKLAQTASVLAFYHSFSPEKIDLECAIPVDKTAKSENDVNVVEFPSTNAVVAHYYGAYTGSAAAHEAIDKWVNDKKLSITGSPWEVYVTDPMMEKDTSKWLTDI
jgi:effector-binding domain-containing protein